MPTERLDRLQRVLATAFCYACFGLGALLLRLIAFPWLAMAEPRPERRALRTKGLIHRAFKAFVGLMRRVGVIELEVIGADKLRRHGLLIVANHPSLIDVVILIALVERADCILKSSLLGNPFTGGPIRAAGYLCNDSGAALVDDCVASLRRGNNLIIFPEGTRTPLAGVPQLRRGAANVAVRGGFDITPVRIRCSPPMLTKGTPWFRVPPRRGHFVVEIGDDIAVATFNDANRAAALATRQLTDHLTDYFFPETPRAAS